jgi:site-specific recombinase XerD
MPKAQPVRMKQTSTRQHDTRQMALDWDGQADVAAPPSCGEASPESSDHTQAVPAQDTPVLPVTTMKSLGSPVVARAPDAGMRSIEEDVAAMELWILARCEDVEASDDGTETATAPEPVQMGQGSGPGPSGALGNAPSGSHTARAYRREAMRFLKWLREVRQRDLGSARLEDALRYRAFLADPQPRERWCGPKGAPVGSPDWRPFEGPLCPRSRRQALVVVKSLYRFLQDQGYLTRNPLSGVAMPRNSSPRIDPGRSLTGRQLAFVLQVANARSPSPPREQLTWCIRFLHETGLRLAEFVGACQEDLRFVELDSPQEPPGPHVQSEDEVLEGDARHARSGAVSDGATGGAWVINVLGKGAKRRDVPVPTNLVRELEQLVARRRSAPASAASTSATPLAVSWRRDPTGRWKGGGALSAQALHRQLKRLLHHAAECSRREGRPADAAALERCSAHWLRHGHGRAAVAAGVPIDVVGHNLGHASLAVTTIYTRPELLRRIEQTECMRRVA